MRKEIHPRFAQPGVVPSLRGWRFGQIAGLWAAWKGVRVPEPRERQARKQALFREVNEQIATMTDDHLVAEFLCECSDLDCIELIEMQHAEHERIRAHSTLFVIKPGHEIARIERVVSREDGYALVEQLVAEEYMEEADPRSDGSKAGSGGA